MYEKAGFRRVPIRIFLFLGAKPSVSLPKASQGDSLAAFLASIQRILLPYETAKRLKKKIFVYKKRKIPPIMLAHIGGI